METRRKLLVAVCLIVGILVLSDAVMRSVEVEYPGGLLMLLLGSVFWLLAEEA